jgi:uncharacterized protein (DUF58 family)
MMSPADWLQAWQSDGVKVASAELMYYRSKVGAFARLQRLRPARSQTGVLQSKIKGRGMEFDEVRHYQAGDDVRSIDWRVTARTGSPHTKLFREERERPVLFVVDLSHAMHFGSQLLLKSVQACHLVAALAWQAVSHGDRVGTLIGNPQGHSELRPQARHHGVMRIIQQLLQQQHQSLNSWQPQAQNDTTAAALNANDVWQHLLQRAQQLAKPGTRIYLISDWAAPQPQQLQLLQALQRHCQVHAIQVFDPLERALPSQLAGHNLSFTDNTRQWLMPAYASVQRQQFQQFAIQQQQALQHLMQQHGVLLTEVSAAQALEQQWPELRL